MTSPKPKHSWYPTKIETVGDEFRTVRLDRGLTQDQVAHMIGVNRNFVYEMELGHHTNTIYALHKVYLFLGYIPTTLKILPDLRGKLFEHRIQNGFTFRVLSKKIGLDKSTIAHYERGGKVKLESASKINKYLILKRK